MSISDATEFDDWLAALYESIGDFTMLVILTEIRERRVTPLCSTYFHVVGDDAEWDSMSLMFAGSGQQWDGAAFFPRKRRKAVQSIIRQLACACRNSKKGHKRPDGPQ